jgi:hypothetical protein
MDDEVVAQEALFEAIQNQIADEDPKETKQTYERLLGEGFAPDDAMKLLAFVLADEINRMLKDNTPFDRALYVQGLKKLPEIAGDA